MQVPASARRRETIRDARGWLIDCFGGDEEARRYIELSNAAEILLSVERYYDGGWEGFVRDGGYPES